MNFEVHYLMGPFLGIVFAPLLPGIINKVKAFYAGRRGPPLLQLYFDLFKLLSKGAVYSSTTSWLFRAGPVITFSTILAALFIIPFGSSAPIAFTGDLLLVFYLLGMARFFTVIAAMDTGSSFEGMGASREVQFSAFAEPGLFITFAAMARLTGCLSLSDIFQSITPELWIAQAPALVLGAVVLSIILLAENARIPVDDPNTHLELTMIHEVMVLDHGGPDFALILYSSALKLWLFASWLAGIVIPRFDTTIPARYAAMFVGVILACIVTGTIESIMARLRLLRIPQLLIGAGTLGLVAFLLACQGGVSP